MKTVQQLYADWRADRITDSTYVAELRARGLMKDEHGRATYEGDGEYAYTESLAQHATYLRVPLRNAGASDDEFMVKLSYGVSQEIVAAEERLAALRELQDRFTA